MNIKRLSALLAVAACLTAVILWTGGFFSSDRIEPGSVPLPADPTPAGTAETATVIPVTDWYEAVGTVRPRTETRVEAQATGKILKILVRPGDRVRRGDDLAVLDSRELSARRDQAGQALRSAVSAKAQAQEAIASAKAAYTKAEAQYRRMQELFRQNAVTSREIEGAEADFLQARASLRQAEDGLRAADAAVLQARKVVEESEVALSYTTIKAYEDGEVAKRLAEPGDLAFPGKPLLILQTTGSLRLEAFVREGLISEVRPGTELGVSITALDPMESGRRQTGDSAAIRGVVEEVVPTADPRTRTFLVKVGLPDIPGLYPGMFGRVFVPMGTRQTVALPETAVRRVGQLETVRVLRGEGDSAHWEHIHVRTGRRLKSGLVEILAGLSGGETVDPGDRS